MNTDLKENNFVLIKEFITPAHAKELATSFEKDAVDKNFTGDWAVPNSYSRYNYRYFTHLLCCKTAEVSNVYGGKVIPTYCYARVYFNGATLVPHTDKEACEVSVTLCLKKDNDWPIFIKKPDGNSVAVELEPGDAMMYRGCIAEHWREDYTGAKHVQVFLHYVDIEGPNRQHYFDRLRGS